MADADRERWNGRYTDRYTQRDYTFQPSSWLLEIEGQLRPSRPDARALDLACGGGRNAVWLAERRWAVDAWDLSDVGLAILSRELDERAARGAPIEVYPQQLDLDEATVPQAVYDLVLNIMFLDRRLWPVAGGVVAAGRAAGVPDVRGCAGWPDLGGQPRAPAPARRATRLVRGARAGNRPL